MIDWFKKNKKQTKRKQRKNKQQKNEGTRIAEEPTHVLETTIGTFLPSFLTESNGYKTDDHMQPQDKVPHSIKQNQDLSTFDITHYSFSGIKKKEKERRRGSLTPSGDLPFTQRMNQVLTLLMLKLIVNWGMF